MQTLLPIQSSSSERNHPTINADYHLCFCRGHLPVLFVRAHPRAGCHRRLCPAVHLSAVVLSAPPACWRGFLFHLHKEKTPCIPKITISPQSRQCSVKVSLTKHFRRQLPAKLPYCPETRKNKFELLNRASTKTLDRLHIYVRLQANWSNRTIDTTDYLVRTYGLE